MAKKDSTSLHRTTLFMEYFRVTFSIILVTTLAMCLVFVIFMVNYWTTNNANTIKRNVASLVSSIEKVDKKGGSVTDETVLLAFHTISGAIGGDFFFADSDGRILICQDLIDDQLAPIHIDVNFCPEHGGIVISKDMLKKTTESGFFTTENFNGKNSIIVGQKAVSDDGKTLGYVYGTLPVSNNLNMYVKNMLKLFAGAAIVSIVFATLITYVLCQRMTEPLREMSKITKLYARGDFTQRIKVKRNDELSDLADQLNKMADSLEVIDESRSAFVANVSHELKTPMTSIGGFIDGMLDGTIPQKEQKKYLRIVSDEVKRLSTLVKTMLLLSKIEAGEEVLKPAKTDIKDILFNALLNFEQQIEEASIDIRGFEEMKPCFIVADENMLYQVVYNLYDNAVKFTDVGGTIHVKLEEEQDRIKVIIANTGEGIQDAELLHIFERFYKVDKSRSEFVKGVGLGLNLAKKIVELHGGEITAVSTPGVLTSFSFWIPKNKD